jgi:lysophospholipase L1-like esterase
VHRGTDILNQDNEGWPGYKVAGVREKASASVPKYRPNLIAINAGTNDGQQDGPDQAPVDMDGLIDDCFENSPGTVILLSTLLPNGNAPEATREINTGYRDIVSRRQAGGQKILLAEMDDGFIALDDILSDNIHPTRLGSQKMAAVWFRGIQEAEQRGWLQPPNDVGVDDSEAGDDVEDGQPIPDPELPVYMPSGSGGD